MSWCDVLRCIVLCCVVMCGVGLRVDVLCCVVICLCCVAFRCGPLSCVVL